MTFSKPLIWAGADADPVWRAVVFLSRRFADRKEGPENGLLAVEVELVGIGEALLDLLAQTRPAGSIGAAAKAPNRLPFSGDDIHSVELAAGRAQRDAREQRREQVLNHPIGIFRIGTREFVGEGVER